MRLLVVEQWPRFAGGSERVSLSLARHAIRRGHDVVLAYGQDGDMLPAYEAVGARPVPVPIAPIAVRRPAEAWRAVSHLRRVVRRERPAVVFTSQVPLAPLIVAAAFARAPRTAVHLGLVYDFPSPVFQHAMRAIDLGVAPSAHTAAGWQARGWPATTLRVIPNGVDDSTFFPGEGRQAARKVLGLAGEDEIIAYVGRLVAAKGTFTLLRAFAAYRRAGGSARLIFAGAAAEGESDALQAEWRAHGLAENACQVWPATSRPEDLYRAADLVVIPSEWDEPFGLVPLEAAACGTLALVSDRGVMPDFVRAVGACAVFRAGDVSDLQARLTYWLANPERREGAAATLHDDIVRRFSFSSCGDAYLQAFTAMTQS